MYTINKNFSEQQFHKLQVQQLVKTETFEVLGISLEKGSLFPEHTSPRDAHLMVLEGDIQFHINGNEYQLRQQAVFHFPKAVTHWVRANEDTKFIIVR